MLVVASALLLGSLSGAALNLVVTALGVGLVVGAHGRFGEPLTIVSSTTPVMMVALGGAFGMHIIQDLKMAVRDFSCGRSRTAEDAIAQMERAVLHELRSRAARMGAHGRPA